MPGNTPEAIRKPKFKRQWGDYLNQTVIIQTSECYIHGRDGSAIVVPYHEMNGLITALREARRNMR